MLEFAVTVVFLCGMAGLSALLDWCCKVALGSCRWKAAASRIRHSMASVGFCMALVWLLVMPLVCLAVFLLLVARWARWSSGWWMVVSCSSGAMPVVCLQVLDRLGRWAGRERALGFWLSGRAGIVQWACRSWSWMVALVIRCLCLPGVLSVLYEVSLVISRCM